MSLPLRTDPLAENTIFGTQQAAWKKDSEVSQLLKKIFGLVDFTTGGSPRLICIGLYIQSSERQASGALLRLPARTLY
jgi:hypothetical protein